MEVNSLIIVHHRQCYICLSEVQKGLGWGGVWWNFPKMVSQGNHWYCISTIYTWLNLKLIWLNIRKECVWVGRGCGHVLYALSHAIFIKLCNLSIKVSVFINHWLSKIRLWAFLIQENPENCFGRMQLITCCFFFPNL